MKRLISFVLVGLLAACNEPITEPPSPNFAARGCEPGPSHHGRGSNPCRLLALLAPVYSVLHNTQDNYYNVSEISTDEMIVPTRGQDWYDGGTWLDLHRQTWTATSPATLTFLNGVWNDAFSRARTSFSTRFGTREDGIKRSSQQRLGRSGPSITTS